MIHLKYEEERLVHDELNIRLHVVEVNPLLSVLGQLKNRILESNRYNFKGTISALLST